MSMSSQNVLLVATNVGFHVKSFLLPGPDTYQYTARTEIGHATQPVLADIRQ